MTLTRVLLVDGDPERAAATAERLERSVDDVRVRATASRVRAVLADDPADLVVVVHDPPAVDAPAVRDDLRGTLDARVPVVLADPGGRLDEAVVVGADGFADRLAARVRGTLAAPPLDDSVPFLAVDDGSRVLRANAEAAALLGLDPTGAVGRSLGEVLPEYPALREAVAAVAATGGRRTVTVDHDGGHVEAWVVPTDAGAVVLLRDATDRVEREAALRRQRDRLEEFARTVAHDLRNPLTVAIGRLDLLAETADLDPDDDDLVALRDALERADDLIDDTLRFARQSVVDDLEPVAVADVARAAWSTAPTEAATLRTRPVGRVLADPEALRRLFENLFRNAVEHAAPDVVVEVGPCASGDGSLGFAVVDDGPGVPPADRDRVFDRSFSTAGGGLGLAVVRQVAAAHGWTVRVTDAVTGGARFEVTGVTAAGDPSDGTATAVAATPATEDRGDQRADGGTED
jgi:signal transduction histidine kinase